MKLNLNLAEKQQLVPTVHEKFVRRSNSVEHLALVNECLSSGEKLITLTKKTNDKKLFFQKMPFTFNLKNVYSNDIDNKSAPTAEDFEQSDHTNIHTSLTRVKEEFIQQDEAERNSNFYLD